MQSGCICQYFLSLHNWTAGFGCGKLLMKDATYGKEIL